MTKYLHPNVTFIVLVWKALFFFSQIQPAVSSIYGFFGKKMWGHRIWRALSRSETKASSNWTPHLKQDFQAFGHLREISDILRHECGVLCLRNRSREVIFRYVIYFNFIAKGQLISKCPFGVIVLTKKTTKPFEGFLLE